MRLLAGFLVLAAAAAVLVLSDDASATYDPVSHNLVEIHVPTAGTQLNGSRTYQLQGIADNDYVVPFQGDEDAPVVRDPRGDATTAHTFITSQDPNTPNDSSGSDIGNVWIAYDDGQQFHIALRLFEEPYVGTSGSSLEYEVIFTQPALTGASVSGRYKVEARQEPGSAWVANLAVEVNNPDLAQNVWCKTGLRPIEVATSMRAPGYQFVFVVEYADLNVDGNGTSSTGIPPFCTIAFGAPAQVGDNLSPWLARSVYKAGNDPSSPATPSAQLDATNAPLGGTYVLGPAVDPYPNGNLHRVRVEINGLLVGNPIVPANNTWTVNADLRAFPSYNCLYEITASFQTIGVAGLANGWAVSDSTPVLDRRYYQRSDCASEDTIQWRVPPPPNPVPDPLSPPAKTRDAQEEPAVSGDHDLDGTGDGGDTCLYVHNGQQADDLDQDHVGDACDGDLDNDGARNGEDNCPAVANTDQFDRDHNNVGDACEQDADQDGWSDALDNCRAAPNVAQQDQDGDRVGDLCDDDVDGDGAANAADAFQTDPRERSDLDSDGLGDNADADADGDGFGDAEELALGSDPFDRDSVPADLGADPDAPTPPAAAGIGAVGSIGIALVLVVLGVLLFLFARPRA